MKIKNIVCDIDGTIIDSDEWHYEALNRALGLFGYNIARDDHLAIDGMLTKNKLDRLSLKMGLPRGLHNFICKMKHAYTAEYVYTKCKPIFCHQYALARLKSEGYGIAVASNSVRTIVDLMMEKSELAQYLDFKLSSEDVENAKPDPEIYNLAIKKFNVKPEEVLVIEDNKYGIQAAKTSGANVLEVKSVYDVNYVNIKSKIDQIEDA